MCFDGIKRLCHIRGKLRKRQWINTSDIILVGLREYQDAKADVIMKYNSDEARRLKNMGQLPDTVNIEFGLTGDNDIVFENDDSDYDENEIAPSRTSRKSVTVKIATKVKPTISKKTLIL